MLVKDGQALIDRVGIRQSIPFAEGVSLAFGFNEVGKRPQVQGEDQPLEQSHGECALSHKVTVRDTDHLGSDPGHFLQHVVGVTDMVQDGKFAHLVKAVVVKALLVGIAIQKPDQSLHITMSEVSISRLYRNQNS